MRIRADLHIHSCLSPCGDLSMSPRAIASTARRVGLNLIALTDHNTARNAPAFAAACAAAGIAALYGCEMTTAEEVHVLALFEHPDAALGLGDLVYDTLPEEPYDAARFGDQPVVNEAEEIVELLERHLIAAASFTLDELGAEIHRRGGLFIPAHVDRSAFSVWSQLGFLPAVPYDAIEVTSVEQTRIDTGQYPLVVSSDAHRLDEIGARSIAFEAPSAGFAGLERALRARQVGIEQR